MRKTFISMLEQAVKQDPNIILITADLGFNVLDEFAKKYPNSYINVGVSEQHMIGLAAGLALTGKKVFVYSIATFATLRCFEQIKVNIAYHDLDVTVVGVGAGLSYSTSGSTHHAVEDIALFRTLPNFSIYCPGDPLEVESCMQDILSNNSPSYLRLGKSGEPNIHATVPQISSCIEVAEQTSSTKKKYALLSTGNMLANAKNIVDTLKNQSVPIHVSLYSCPLVKPFDVELFKNICESYDMIFSVEEHVGEGGFGSLLSEVIVDMNIPVKYKRFNLKSQFLKVMGSQTYLRDISNLSDEYIVNAINEIVEHE